MTAFVMNFPEIFSMMTSLRQLSVELLHHFVLTDKTLFFLFLHQLAVIGKVIMKFFLHFFTVSIQTCFYFFHFLDIHLMLFLILFFNPFFLLHVLFFIEFQLCFQMITLFVQISHFLHLFPFHAIDFLGFLQVKFIQIFFHL